jgi:uncharacterized membrane protein
MTSTRGGRPLTWLAWSAVWLLIAVVVVFLVIRVTSDIGDLSSGNIPPEEEFDHRYVVNPWPAYLHILPGTVYLLGAPFQLSVRIRRRNIRFHRGLGRVLLVAGAVTGVFAIVIGIMMPFGDFAEMSATLVFGLYFLAALVLAYRAIRSGRVSIHRRFMIRAFAVGVGVGMIRIVVGIGEAFGIGIEQSFGAAFWIAFVVLAFLAEVWLRLRPDPPD